jgi:hypothetical protein
MEVDRAVRGLPRTLVPAGTVTLSAMFGQGGLPRSLRGAHPPSHT